MVASQAPEEEPGVYRIRVSHGELDWTIRCVVPRAGRSGGPAADAVTAALHERVVWSAPHLFVREAHGDRTGWRSTVDHVFKLSSEGLVRLGTVAAGDGPPGSQLRDGVFRDLYDRLEYTFLTSRQEAPRFTLLMRDVGNRLVVDREATWREGAPSHADALAELQRLTTRPEQRSSERDQRRVRGLAMRVLAFTRYCERPEEYQAALTLAKATVEDLDSVIAEVATVQPGELAPSAEEVFRANPALINLFRETPAAGSPPEATPFPTPGPGGIGLSPL